MRILQVMAGGEHGGAEVFFEDLAAALNRAGLDQSIAVRRYLDRQRVLSQIGCPVVNLPFKGAVDFWTPLRLRKLAQEWQPDVILGWMNRACRALPRGPWVNVGRLGGYYDLKYYRNCDHLVCNTADIKNYVIGHDWPVGRAHFIPNFCPVDDSPAIERSQFDTPKNAIVLLVLARLHSVKGIDVALRALRDIDDAILWIAGDGPERASLRSLSISLGVSERVRFIGWRSDRSALLKAANVCLVPSRYEPFGNVVINAWTHGVPLIASASKGPSQLVRNGEDGLLFPVEEFHALSAAVKRIVSDPVLAASLVENGKARVSSEFSEEVVVHQYRELFERITG